nr:DUF350 domain-containing protein [Leptolyngbya sp. FACHB-671]
MIGVLLLYAAIRLFDAVDPINYQTEIRQGNIAAGVVVAALIIATAAIIISVIVT